MAERIEFQTIGDVRVVGTWTTAPTTLGVVLLVHSMPSDRTGWEALQNALREKNVASLSIDLRGHGESIQGPEGSALSYKQFSDEDHQSSIFDLIGALTWLKERKVQPSNIAIAGASIGANLAIQLLEEESTLSGAALLSPGKDYHGLLALEDIQNILPDQRLWIVASEGDDQESFETAQTIYEGAPCEDKTFVRLKNAGHALDLFASQPQLVSDLATWLAQTAQGASV